jgi:hypothetical protein
MSDQSNNVSNISSARDGGSNQLIGLPENIRIGWFMDTDTWKMKPVGNPFFEYQQGVDKLQLEKHANNIIDSHEQTFKTVNERIDYENKIFESDKLLKGAMSAGISINKLVDIGGGVSGHSGDKGKKGSKIIKFSSL